MINPLNGQQSDEMKVTDTSDGEETRPAREAAGSEGEQLVLTRDERAALTEKALGSIKKTVSIDSGMDICSARSPPADNDKRLDCGRG